MQEGQLLIKLARKSIETEFNKNLKFDKEDLIKNAPFLNELRACFVTLTLNNKLRGCMGSLVAHRILLDDILHNAKAAAFSDFRFSSLREDEFKEIKIEISLLSVPVNLEYKDFEDLKEKLEINKPGVILELEGKRATYLPSVWEQLTTFDEFIPSLCKKAGLNPSKLSAYPKIQIYEASKIKEL